jgi:hypothetical protein
MRYWITEEDLVLRNSASYAGKDLMCLMIPGYQDVISRPRHSWLMKNFYINDRYIGIGIAIESLMGASIPIRWAKHSSRN